MIDNINNFMRSIKMMGAECFDLLIKFSGAFLFFIMIIFATFYGFGSVLLLFDIIRHKEYKTDHGKLQLIYSIITIVIVSAFIIYLAKV